MITDEMRKFLEDEMRKFLEGVVGCVEANNFEYHALWGKYSTESECEWPTKYTWESNPSGMGAEVGKIDNRSVFLSLRTANVNGKKILFYEATSVLVDWDMIEKWLNKNLDGHAFRDDGQLNKTDADGFNCLMYSLLNN